MGNSALKAVGCARRTNRFKRGKNGKEKRKFGEVAEIFEKRFCNFARGEGPWSVKCKNVWGS